MSSRCSATSDPRMLCVSGRWDERTPLVRPLRLTYLDIPAVVRAGPVSGPTAWSVPGAPGTRVVGPFDDDLHDRLGPVVDLRPQRSRHHGVLQVQSGDVGELEDLLVGQRG